MLEQQNLKNPKVVALVPARSGSKGVVDKNIRVLAGHSLLEWSIAACKKSSLIERTIVSTDSREYALLATQAGAEVPFLRPSELASDTSTDYDFVCHALDWFSSNGGEPDIIVHIRPTTPLRNPSVIDCAIDTFCSSPDATALRSVQEMAESAYKSFEIRSNTWLQSIGADEGSLDYANNARQSFPKTYTGNGYVDVLSSQFIRTSNKLHGEHVLAFVTPHVTEVDVELDLQYLQHQVDIDRSIHDTLFGP